MDASDKLDLIRDVLDKLLVDGNKVPLGRVDGIVLEVRGEAQPRVIQLESGSVTLMRRLSIRLATIAHRISRRVGFHWTRPVRIDWTNVKRIGKEVVVNVVPEDSRLLARERWLRDHVIRHIPGNGVTKEGK